MPSYYRTSLGTFTPLGARAFGARGRRTQSLRRAGVISYETTGYDFRKGELKVWFAAWGDRKDKSLWHVREYVRRPPTQYELRRAKQVVFGIERPSGEVLYKSRGGGIDV